MCTSFYFCEIKFCSLSQYKATLPIHSFYRIYSFLQYNTNEKLQSIQIYCNLKNFLILKIAFTSSPFTNGFSSDATVHTRAHAFVCACVRAHVGVVIATVVVVTDLISQWRRLLHSGVSYETSSNCHRLLWEINSCCCLELLSMRVMKLRRV